MMNLKTKLSLFAIVILISSCSKTNNEVFNDKVTLVFKEHLLFELDSETKRNSKIVGYSKKLNSIYLFNEFNYSIYFFDLETKSLTNKLELEKDGPNGVGEISKLTVLSKDSIFAYSRHTNYLYQINSGGHIVDKSQVFSLDEPDPSIQTYSPSVFFLGKTKDIFLPIRPNSRTERKRQAVMLKYNVSNGKKEYIKIWPEEYRDYSNIGTTSYATLNQRNSKLLISFSFDPNIHVIDLINGNDVVQYFGSGKVPEMKEFKGRGDMENVIKYMTSTSYYRNVFYDEHKN